MSIPRDIDLTLKMDFNKEEKISPSINIPKEVKDTSYKRYNEYKDDSLLSTTTLDDWGLFNTNPSFNTSTFSITNTGSIRSISDSFTATLWGSNIVKVEERVCWRKLYKDPEVYEESHTPEEWNDIIKNDNFPLGSRDDRLVVFLKKKKKLEDPWYSRCDRCGKLLNKRNCLSYYYDLCQKCNTAISEEIPVVRL